MHSSILVNRGMFGDNFLLKFSNRSIKKCLLPVSVEVPLHFNEYFFSLTRCISLAAGFYKSLVPSRTMLFLLKQNLHCRSGLNFGSTDV